MNLIVESSIKILEKSRSLLSILNNSQLSDDAVPPYYSSIGSHIRHILDFYNCILNSENNIVDLTARERDQYVENFTESALNYLESIILKLKLLPDLLDKDIIVIDDLGLGKIKMKYTLSSLLAQANSHTIHHYSIINYILSGLNIEFGEDQFGVNPTTPYKKINR